MNKRNELFFLVLTLLLGVIIGVLGEEIVGRLRYVVPVSKEWGEAVLRVGLPIYSIDLARKFLVYGGLCVIGGSWLGKKTAHWFLITLVLNLGVWLYFMIDVSTIEIRFKNPLRDTVDVFFFSVVFIVSVVVTWVASIKSKKSIIAGFR